MTGKKKTAPRSTTEGGARSAKTTPKRGGKATGKRSANGTGGDDRRTGKNRTDEVATIGASSHAPASGHDDAMARAVHDVMHPSVERPASQAVHGPVSARVPANEKSVAREQVSSPPKKALLPPPPLTTMPAPKRAAAFVPAPAPEQASEGSAPTVPASVEQEAPRTLHTAPVPVTPPEAQAKASSSGAAQSVPLSRPGPKPLPVPDFDELSRNMSLLMEESGKIATSFCDAEKPRPVVKADVTDAVQTFGQLAEHWFGDPGRFVQAQTALTAQFFNLWAASAQRVAGGAAEAGIAPAGPVDKRFSDPEWRENPVYDFVHKAFLLGSSWANGLIDGAEGLDDATREKARFYMRQITSAMSPSNFVPTNPELIRETLKENGGNLLRGMKMLAEDLAAGNGQLRIRQTDTSKFKLGVNMALTPGKVVFRNDLMELLEYAPATPEVLARPLLIVPPWINKFYVLDLNPEKSFIRWAVGQGLTVFLISWVNPDERHADKDFEAYMREGILTALDEIGAITGQPDATAIGYCVGGTLLAVTLAHMAAQGDTRISSATLFTAQVDFSHAGDLKVFADESQISSLEVQMREQGYLRGSHMAQAFNMLRPEDLIWSYVVNNYLKGKEPPAFDLLAWNSDSTRMPAANHSFYLRNCYLENNLAHGRMEIAGQTLNLKRVTVPIYNLATREDHIAPAISVFEGCRYFGGPVRYVLSGSGHVAGVVNPPAKVKYGYTDGPEPVGTLDEWLQRATTHPGSWWPDWVAWIRAQAPALVPARTPGGGRPVLADAPGTYVRVKA